MSIRFSRWTVFVILAPSERCLFWVCQSRQLLSSQQWQHCRLAVCLACLCTHRQLDTGKNTHLFAICYKKSASIPLYKIRRKLLKSLRKWPETFRTMAQEILMTPPFDVCSLWTLGGLKCSETSPEIILWHSHRQRHNRNIVDRKCPANDYQHEQNAQRCFTPHIHFTWLCRIFMHRWTGGKLRFLFLKSQTVHKCTRGCVCVCVYLYSWCLFQYDTILETKWT